MKHDYSVIHGRTNLLAQSAYLLLTVWKCKDLFEVQIDVHFMSVSLLLHFICHHFLLTTPPPPILLAAGSTARYYLS